MGRSEQVQRFERLVKGAEREAVTSIAVSREMAREVLDYITSLEPELPFKVGDRVEEICEGELEEAPVGTVTALEDHRGVTLFRITLENTKHAGLDILFWPDEIKKIEE
jgi:hypothetical protein